MEQCSLCRFWLNWDSEMTNLGECHRYPPPPAAARTDADERGWPLTAPDDWCGEFQRPPARAGEARPASPQAEGEVGPGGI